MKKLLALIPCCFIMSGCPGKGDGINIGKWKPILIDSKRVCFSIDNKDILNSYYLESNEGNKNNIILSSHRKKINITYPDTCISIKLKMGYQYGTMYTLNNIKYHYEFFIDNNWNVIDSRGF